jgi:serine protease Do
MFLRFKKTFLIVFSMAAIFGFFWAVLIIFYPEKISNISESITAFASKKSKYILPKNSSETQSENSSQDKAFLKLFSKVFVNIGKQAKPALVMIQSERKVKGGGQQSPFPDDFFFPFLPPEFRNREEKDSIQKGAGSGFIVDLEKGYVVTNNHVIDSAQKINITTFDDKNYKAKLLGRHKKFDIAVLEIQEFKDENKKNLKQVFLTDSDNVEVGDWAVALGAPFQLPQTLTVGVVSALARNAEVLGMGGSLSTFIQTDAAINPGNSGGPLLDINGQVMGMNTAIYTKTGSYAGVGFAIPANTIRMVATSIIDTGRFERPYIGTEIAPLDIISESARKNLKIPKDTNGVLVTKVVPESPAEKADIKPHDVIISINDKEVKSPGILISEITKVPMGGTITLGVLRAGKIKKLKMEVQKLDMNSEDEDSTEEDQEEPRDSKDFQSSLKYGISPKSKEKVHGKVGVKISIQENSHAFASGLRTDDVILEINKQSVKSADEFEKALQNVSKGDDKTLLLTVSRKEKSKLRGGTVQRTFLVILGVLK